MKFQIRSGSASGQLFDVKDGAVLGRAASCDIVLTDRKISGRHAKIEKDDAGNYILVDLGSTNGLRVEKQRVQRIRLVPGLMFRAGSTLIEIIQTEDVPTTSQNSPTQNPPSEPPPVPQAAPTPKELSWDEYLSQFSSRARKKVRNLRQPLLPFDPLLVLTIIRGMQVGTQWVIGYGPRELGLDTLEFHILESPPLAFRVSPKGELAYFETPHPKEVRLNGSSVSAETLHAGDEIQISNTIIKVAYKE